MPDPTILELLSPATLARIDDYSFLARVVVEGFLSGLHRSLLHGYGSEFFQYRNYAPGDDLKYLDWKVFARRDRFYSKVFQEETSMNCCLVLDTSASMAYRGSRAPCTKLHYASMVAACLAYLATRQGDQVGLYAYADDVRCALKPGCRLGHFQRLVAELARLRPHGRANHDHALTTLAGDLRRRGVVVFLSDLLEAEDAIPQVLRRFRFAHHECVVVQVLDPDELDFPFERTTRFIDAEQASQIVTAPPTVRAAYQQAMDAFLERIRVSCLEMTTDYLLARSSDNLGNTLAAYLHRRESLQG